MAKKIPENKKTVSYWIDRDVVEKFDTYIEQFSGVSKQEIIGFLMDYCAELKPDEFIRSFKAYMTEKIDREIGRKMPDKKA